MPKSRRLASPTVYELQAALCSAMAHPVRLQIIDLLSHGPQTSSELLTALQVPKANLSQHVSVLRKAGLVSAERDGQFQRLSLTLPRISEACAMVKQVLKEKAASEERAHAQLKRELSAAGRSSGSRR